MPRPNLPTCKENCGCECDYDVKACRDFDAGVAHKEAHQAIVQAAYDRAFMNHLRNQDENA